MTDSLVTDEPLTTGWEPDVPVGDTVVRRFVLNSADRVRHLSEAGDGTWRAWDDVCLGDTGARSPFGNQAILLRPLDEASVADVATRLRDGFIGCHLVVSAWPTPDLRPFGYFLVGHPPFMLRPPGGAAPVRPAELHVTEVTDAESLAAYEQVFVDGYPIPELQPFEAGRLFDTRVLGGVARAWVGSVDGRPVAGAMAITSRGVVDVENVATLPDTRGRGYGAALTATAALSTPDLPAVLIASDDGRPVYERLGFLPISRFTLWAQLS